MNLERIDEIIAKNINITDKSLYEGVFNAVLEAVNEENEACALVAESYEPTCETCPSGVANAIRARSET